MSFRKVLRSAWVQAAVGLSLSVHALSAQELTFHRPRVIPQECPSPSTPATPLRVVPVPSYTDPIQNLPAPSTSDPAPIAQAPSALNFDSPIASAGLTDFASLPMGGYIDTARPMTQFRLRYDIANDNNAPDRAEFFYPKCGCFGAANGGRGPILPEKSVSYQDVTAYFEYAPTQRLSAFIEAPYRFLNPDQNANANGFSDLQLGFKAAAIARPDLFVTGQLRVYVPTGDGTQGLGTEHVSLEPAILFWKQFCNNWRLEGEVRDWISVGGTEFAGNVLRYGIGVNRPFYVSTRSWVAPVIEAVGWTVVSGQGSNFDGTIYDAAGQTIVNGKLGLRFGIDRHSLYAGYGRALTGNVWYHDMYRFEYRFTF